MLGSSDLSGYIATLNSTGSAISNCRRALRHASCILLKDAIRDLLLFAIVEKLHVFIDIILLANLRSESDAHLVSSIRSQRLRILITCLNFMHRGTLFTTRTNKYLLANNFHLRLNTLVFIIDKLAPLIKSVKFKLSAITASSLLQEG